METFELYYMKKAFAPLEKRFTNLRKEALRLKYLWTYEKRPNRCRTRQELQTWYNEVVNCIENNEQLTEASKLITKMLKHDPKSYKIYALRATVFKLQGKVTDAIKNYEIARLMLKFAKISNKTETDMLYIESLIECYEIRGDCFNKNGLFLQAAKDYERIVTLKPSERSIIDIEDKLLQTMMHINKYDAFCSYWYEFIKNTKAKRMSDLLTIHAKYKFDLRDIDLTREFILEALSLNEDNVKAKKLLQKMYELARTMSIHSIIWCMHRCYDKGLYTIQKVCDYDPSNLQYILIKAMILRLSGRINEALSCLGKMQNILETKKTDDSLFKITDSTSAPFFSAKEIKQQIKKQYLLARYNDAVQYKIKQRRKAKRRRSEK
ncbi:PREDICTED: uncharacterized protein LOC107069219 [Polistes dominula]|uniref:Uncharacterized protein LOC107069219 n=1 Tax=Polistes dominula TaxID=743375 RepID=A0ABM1INL4_POLDO|nr:PREDICTED: uncharacterized protein LOC107069219 [Polistes dominula]